MNNNGKSLENWIWDAACSIRRFASGGVMSDTSPARRAETLTDPYHLSPIT
jgi:hypothetical protein